MRSITTISARLTITAVILALPTLVACGNDPMTSPVAPPLTTNVAYCAALQPVWVAFQDGDGVWTRAQPVSDGNDVTFQQVFTANRGAIATARTVQPGQTVLSIQYGLTSELALFGDTNPAHCGQPVPKTLLGTVAGLGTSDFAAVNAGFGSRAIVAPQGTGNNNYSLSALIDGPQDVLATRTTQVVGGTNLLTGIILRRTPALVDNATIPVLDFNSVEAFAPAVANMTINGIGAEGAMSVTRLRTAHGENEISFLTNAPVTAATRSYNAIPETRLEPGDLQLALATSTPNSTNSGRSATVYFRAPVNLLLTLGAPVIAPVLSTVATTPSLRLRARLEQQSDYDRTTAVTYQQGPNTQVTVSETAAYAAPGVAGYELIVPDLSVVSGFDTRWSLRAGEPVSWTAVRTGGTLGLGFNAVPTSGATLRSSFTFGTFVP